MCVFTCMHVCDCLSVCEYVCEHMRVYMYMKLCVHAKDDWHNQSHRNDKGP